MINWKKISPYFTPDEIFSPGTINFPWLVDVLSLEKLNLFREHINKPLLVNTPAHRRRGVRSASEQMALVNMGLTKATSSMHCCGKAFDISCPDLSPEELSKAAHEFGWGGIGLYPSFVHVDDRDSLLAEKGVAFWSAV